MQCHTNNEQSCYFSTRSDFKPFAAPIAQTQAEPKKQHKEPQYLPGEKLLISLHKNRQKEKKKNDNIDVDRLSKSLNRVLAGF
jgi:hypothetical protein